MSQVESPAPPAPESTVPPKKPVARHPFRVYGYKATHEWVLKFGRQHGLDVPGMKDHALESAVFMYLIGHLPGFQHHFLDDPSDAEYGWCHCLGIANNWNAKKRSRAAERLPKWKGVLSIEEEPRWYMPTADTIPYVPPGYPMG